MKYKDIGAQERTRIDANSLIGIIGLSSSAFGVTRIVARVSPRWVVRLYCWSGQGKKVFPNCSDSPQAVSVRLNKSQAAILHGP